IYPLRASPLPQCALIRAPCGEWHAVCTVNARETTEMTTVTWVILAIAIIAIVIAALMTWKVQRSKHLRSKFGPEYDRLVHERGSSTRAEKELDYRAKRVEKFHIRPLSHEESDRFAAEWRTAQEHFVDDPRGAVVEADELVHRAMKAEGYPIGGDFE